MSGTATARAWQARGLSPERKLVLLALAQAVDGGRPPTLRQLADLVSGTASGVADALDALKDSGHMAAVLGPELGAGA